MADNVSNVSIIDQIYRQILSVMGVSSNQTFIMEAPGRVLDEATYAFPADSIYASIEKPQPVIEAEFRLSDNLFDVSSLVGGPNGKLLSLQYQEALNSLVPDVGKLNDYEKDREHLRAWLLEVVSLDDVDGKKFTGSRMELFTALSDVYLQHKSKWEQEKTTKLDAAMKTDANVGTDDAMNAYTRWLANEAPVIEAGLEALFADLVVRGYYHEVRTYLGYIDVASPAEALEDAKARLRATSMSALDESETIYPVQTQPVDWFRALSTDFKPVDLLLDPEFLQQRLIGLETQLDQLTSERTALVASSTGDPKKLESQVQQAQQALDAAQSAQIEQFTNATISVVEIAVKAYAAEESMGATEVVDKLASGDDQATGAVKQEAQELSSGFPLTDEQLEELGKLQKATIEAQTNLNNASRALADLEAKHAAAEATDTKKAVAALDTQIAQIRAQAQELKRIVLSEKSGDAAPASLPSDTPQAGRWYDLILSTSDNTKSSSSDLQASSSQTSWNVDLILGSASGSSDTESSNFASQFQATTSTIEVGFRATKVTIDRGGWFDPGLLDQTAHMYKLPGASAISTGPPTTDDQGVVAKDEARKHDSDVLPSFATAFVVAKDVTIKVSLTENVSSDVQNYLHEASSAGGGFLCFSVSHSQSSTASSQSFYSQASAKQVIIRIPGPQILGWIVNYVAADGSQQFVKLPAGFPPTPEKTDTSSGEQDEPQALLAKSSVPPCPPPATHPVSHIGSNASPVPPSVDETTDTVSGA